MVMSWGHMLHKHSHCVKSVSYVLVWPTRSQARGNHSYFSSNIKLYIQNSTVKGTHTVITIEVMYTMLNSQPGTKTTAHTRLDVSLVSLIVACQSLEHNMGAFIPQIVAIRWTILAIIAISLLFPGFREAIMRGSCIIWLINLLCQRVLFCSQATQSYTTTHSDAQLYRLMATTPGRKQYVQKRITNNNV